MLTMNSHGVEISIAGCVARMVRDPNLMPFLFFIFILFYFILFYFIFYHAFIVSRYKKLRAALAMERTKPINQNISTKETIFLVLCGLLKVLRPKPSARRSFMEKNIRKLQL